MLIGRKFEFLLSIGNCSESVNRHRLITWFWSWYNQILVLPPVLSYLISIFCVRHNYILSIIAFLCVNLCVIYETNETIINIINFDQIFTWMINMILIHNDKYYNIVLKCIVDDMDLMKWFKSTKGAKNMQFIQINKNSYPITG